MADVLSQSQIDALLNSMQNSGADEVAEKPKKPEKEYKKYDFFSPKKYTKDKLKMLSSIYDNYSRIFTSQINGLFRVASEVEVVGVEESARYWMPVKRCIRPRDFMESILRKSVLKSV